MLGTFLWISLTSSIVVYYLIVYTFQSQPNQPQAKAMSNNISLEERYEACMVLSGVGDALAYNHGDWEFEQNGKVIHAEVKKKGGIAKLDAKHFPVSDDTVMHLATAEALVEAGEGATLPQVYLTLVREYIKSMKDMHGRAPGLTCMSMMDTHNKRNDQDWKVKFNRKGGGCGAAMRAMCIGLRFPNPEQEDLLINLSVESGRLTHHHPTGYLGSLAAALFTAYAVRGSPPVEAWGHGLMEVLEKAKQYVKDAGHCVEENLLHWNYFEESWRKYLEKRNILDGKSQPLFPEVYGIQEREEFYKSLSFQGTGGASGHDAPMIAYDALLRAGESWVELANHGFFHGGDSDSTGVIAAAWWGALYAYTGVPKVNYKGLEYRARLAGVAKQLYKLRGKPLLMK
ncbi:ADP-ribosylhydrolase ARH1-like isoform X1 [Osmerus eperlanus]|uniref:ADP-ribosylhydrolase ARH1-like isoform X1 n=2 Tax=Osmerus eperlanus TaxID=29151 RepID=UPI002E0EE2D4